MLAVVVVVLALAVWIGAGSRLGQAVLGFATPRAHAEVAGRVQGVVANDVGRRLPGAHVFLTRAGGQVTQRTDSAGEYRFETVHPGRYVVRVFRLDYLDAERVVEVHDGESVRADFRLHPRRP